MADNTRPQAVQPAESRLETPNGGTDRPQNLTSDIVGGVSNPGGLFTHLRGGTTSGDTSKLPETKPSTELARAGEGSGNKKPEEGTIRKFNTAIGDNSGEPGERPSREVGDQNGGNPGDDPTKPTIQPAQGDKPAMWQPPGGKAAIALPTDMDPSGATIDASGHLVYTNKEGNKVDVNPDNGRETTTTKDGTQITRNHVGGEITDYHSSDPNGPKCENGIWSNLPGLTAEGQKNHLKYENGTEAGSVQVDPSTGKVKSYVTDAGVTVTLNDNGKPVKYSSNGFSFEYHADNNTWYYHQDGEGHDYVKIDIPTLDENGIVKTRENGGIHSGRDHEINGGGQKTGSGVIGSQTFLSGLTRNALHSLIDDNLNMALKPVNSLLGTHIESHVATPVDPDHASAAEIAGGALGSALGVVGIGKLKTAAEIAKAAKKAVVHETKDMAKDHHQNDPSRWQTWYRWFE